jgi:DNA polymerase-3 subunit alpha
MIHETTGFAHIHTHSFFSILDGVMAIGEGCKKVIENNQKFLCITDHGQMGAIPQQISLCEKFGILPIHGCELYLNPFQPACRSREEYKTFVEQLNPEEQRKLRKSFHLIALATNEVGYKNLVNLSSWAWIFGLGGRPLRPRINYDVLSKYKNGIIFSSACYNSEIGQAFDGFYGSPGDESGFEMVRKYKEMLGDSFYLELMMLDFNKQKPYDAFLIRAYEKFGIPLVLTNDSHYAYKEDSQIQRISLMIQTGNTLRDIDEKLRNNPDADLFELQDTNLWMKSEDELNEMWETKYSDTIDYELYKEAKRNSVRICEVAKGVEIDRSMKLPQIPDADDKLKQLASEGFITRRLPRTKEYITRFKEEYDLICRKGFSSYFLIQKEIVDEARRYCREELKIGDGSAAVGPGRGSAVGSLICYCLKITDVDPIKHDLLFSRFLNESRGGRSLKLRFTGMEPIGENK